MSEVTGKRRKEPRFDEFAIPEYRVPVWSESQLHEMHKAALVHAERHASDPFAYARILCHMKRGIANVQQVSADARGVALHD